MAHTGDYRYVRYGVPIKIRHVLTGHALHSHTIVYTTGSHQQEVTCYSGRDDNDWWVVKGPNSTARYNCPIGTCVKNGSVVRLEHLLTEKNLHSHNGIFSPATHQGEVTAYGSNGVGDENDNWKIELVNPQNDDWAMECRFRLIHVSTNHALHSHAGHETHSHQQEVTGFDGRDDNDLWQVEFNS